jgi:trehalose 2-sulfotransferase
VTASAGYLLCGTPRTGSTLLCGLLASTGVLGRPRSWFREADETDIASELGVPIAGDRPADYRQYVQAVSDAGRTPNGVFAARIMWGSLDHVVAELAGPDQPCDLDVLQNALGPLAVIHLRRTDTVGQAVSWCRAEQTGFWQQGDPPNRPRTSPNSWTSSERSTSMRRPGEPGSTATTQSRSS